jgi:nucleotide-binding universal stress UspA family protein
MKTILALIDDSPTSPAVMRNATVLGQLLDLQVQPIRAAGPDPADRLLAALTRSDVAFAVLGSRSVQAKPEAAGHIAQAVLTASPVPLVVIPPTGVDLPTDGLRILVPLDGDPDTDAAVVDVANTFVGSGAVVSGVHVFDSTSLPPFIESAEDVAVLAEQFFADHLPHHEVTTELRIGQPGTEILGMVESAGIDAVLIAWRQELTPGKADTVQHLLRHGAIPLILVPIPATP